LKAGLSQNTFENSFSFFTQKFVNKIGIVVPHQRKFFKKVFRFQGRKSFFLIESHVLFHQGQRIDVFTTVVPFCLQPSIQKAL